MSSKDIATHVPMFVGQDFCTWLEKMMDYLGSQRLLGYVLLRFFAYLRCGKQDLG
jgi:hypothetical protein